MTDSHDQRLPAAFLDDLAFVTLTAVDGASDVDLYPEIDDGLRSHLRSRLKQITRYDWPATIIEDPDLRKGYTLRQCFRFVATLLLLDASVPLRTAVALARDNERAFLAVIATRLNDPSRSGPEDDDVLAVVIPAEVRTALMLCDSDDRQVREVRLVSRDQLVSVWSNPVEGAGSRLLIDVGGVALFVWRWLSGRRLMTDVARTQLLEVSARQADSPRYDPVPFRNRRR